MKILNTILSAAVATSALISIENSAFAQGGTWTAKAPISLARYDLGAAELNGVLYAVGGWRSPCSPQRLLEAYDPVSNVWIVKQPMPTARDLHAEGTGALGGLLYSIGGAIGCGVNVATVEVYDPATDNWSSTTALATPRRGHAVAVLDGILYVVGGAVGSPSGPPTATVVAYNPATATWSSRASMNTPRHALGIGVVGGRIYAVGGYDGVTALASVETYDPGSDTWTMKSAMPTPRNDLGVGVLNGILYAVGGLVNGAPSSIVEAYDPASDSWYAETPMLAPRSSHGVGVANGALYAIAGANASGHLDSVEAFTPARNEAPICSAGSDRAVNEGDVVQLDGCASTDPTPTGTLRFRWTQLAGTAVTLSDATTCNPTFTAPFVSIGGETLTFQVEVSDGELSCTDTVDISVVNVNHPPVANAGADQTVAELSPVTLHGELSFDCDADAFSFMWVQTAGPAVMLSGADTTNPTFTAPAIPGGDPGATVTLTFTLTVSDGFPLDRPCDGFTFDNRVDTVNVTVENLNHDPVANAGDHQTVNEGAAVTLHGENSTDPDDDALEFAWTQLSGPAVVLNAADTANPYFTAPLVSTGGADLEFVLTVHDGFGSMASDQVVVHVQNVNDPPNCSHARPTIAVLWPPNHKLVRVGITGVSDPNNDPVTITVTSVTQDEPTNGLGDGDTAPDAVIQEGAVLLRAERSGKGNGRVYRLAFTVTDTLGGSCSGLVIVCVPHDMRPGNLCIDDGLVFDSTVSQ